MILLGGVKKMTIPRVSSTKWLGYQSVFLIAVLWLSSLGTAWAQGVIDTPPGDVTITVGESVNFTATVGQLGDAYEWDFGGGAVPNVLQDVQDPGPITFDTVGVFTVTFTVFIDIVTGSQIVREVLSEDSRVITVEAPNQQPIASIDAPAGNVTINAGESVNFAGTGTDPDNNTPLSYAWDFGGGAPNSTLEDPGSVTFNTAGTFSVSFTVTDSLGLASTPATRTVTVQAAALAPVAVIDSPASNVSINVGESVNFAGTGTDPGGDTQLTFFWEFEGGTPASSTVEDPGNVTFNATGTFTVTFTVTDSQGLSAMDTRMVTVGGGIVGLLPRNTPGQDSVARVIEIVCPQGIADADFQRDCNALIGGAQDPGAADAVAQITIDEASTPVDAALGSVDAQARNVGSRLAALRGGATGLSARGLVFNVKGLRLSPDELAGLFDIQDETGGAAGADDDFGPWGFFISGDITFGDKDSTINEAGFDFDTQGITAGVDYRLSDSAVLGAAFGYVNTDTDLDANGGSLDGSGYSLTVYGTYYQDENFYLDSSLSYGWHDYDQDRNIRYNLASNNTVVDQTLLADYDGSQFSFTLGGGYEFSQGAFSFGPVSQLQYVDADVDGYQERAADSNSDGSGWTVELDDQEYESLTLSLGGQTSYVMSQSWGVLVPQARFDWVHEFEDDNRLISGRFLGDPSRTQFSLPTDEADSDYFNLGLGMSAIFSEGKSAFLYYQTTLGFDDLEHHSFSGGIRWEW